YSPDATPSLALMPYNAKKIVLKRSGSNTEVHTKNGTLPPKVGASVILLRNIFVSKGLCNGSRLRIVARNDHFLTCELLTTECAKKIKLSGSNTEKNDNDGTLPPKAKKFLHDGFSFIYSADAFPGSNSILPSSGLNTPVFSISGTNQHPVDPLFSQLCTHRMQSIAWYRERFEKVIAAMDCCEAPDVFITMQSNASNMQEFPMKELFDDIVKKEVLGPVIACYYSIEMCEEIHRMHVALKLKNTPDEENTNDKPSCLPGDMPSIESESSPWEKFIQSPD
ncbi:hypothetical protein PMAYCL1PPCAC_02844, partial [Pristionchus mayeri]